MTTTHAQLMQSLKEQFAPLFAESPDGVYLWLDETQKVCSERLAKLFGYTIEEWTAAAPFLDTFVAPEDRELFSWNYHNHVVSLTYPVTFRFRALRKDGSSFAAETDMIPFIYEGHPVAYHFVRQTGD